MTDLTPIIATIIDGKDSINADELARVREMTA
jgi:hypothetical protein